MIEKVPLVPLVTTLRHAVARAYRAQYRALVRIRRSGQAGAAVGVIPLANRHSAFSASSAITVYRLNG